MLLAVSSPATSLEYLCNSSLLFTLDGVELLFVGIGFIVTPLLIFLYSRINARRETELKRIGGITKFTVEELHELGDRALDFKYTL